MLYLLQLMYTVSAAENVALGQNTFQSGISYSGDPRRAVDGNKDPTYSNLSCTHTALDEMNPWWAVDLQRDRVSLTIYISNRSNVCKILLYVIL